MNIKNSRVVELAVTFLIWLALKDEIEEIFKQAMEEIKEGAENDNKRRMQNKNNTMYKQ